MAIWSDIYFEVSNDEGPLHTLIADDKIVVLNVQIFIYILELQNINFEYFCCWCSKL